MPSWYPTESLPVNGVFCQDQAHALHRVGLKVGVVYPDLRSLREFDLAALKGRRFQTVVEEEFGVPTVRLNGWHIPLSRGHFKVIWSLRLLEMYIKRFGRPDLIHAHCTLWAGVAARASAKRFSLPYLITEHSSAFLRQQIQPWQINKLQDALCGADKVLSVSQVLAEQLRAYCGNPDLLVHIIPNMIDTDFFFPPHQPRQLRPFRILSVALLTPNKGVDILIRAFAKTFRNSDEVVLEIGGDGPHQLELIELASRLGVGQRVRFLGMLSREQVREAMWRSNLFVCASYKETFGLVLLEAIATGLPVVATRCGGPEEFVRTSNGLLVEPGDVNGLGSAILEVFNQYEKYNGFATADSIRQTIQPFCQQVVVGKLLEHYNEILSKYKK